MSLTSPLIDQALAQACAFHSPFPGILSVIEISIKNIAARTAQLLPPALLPLAFNARNMHFLRENTSKRRRYAPLPDPF
jgi:hypothetical protein